MTDDNCTSEYESGISEHGLEVGDRLRSKRRQTELTVREVRDTTVYFGEDVGEKTHREVMRGLRSGKLEYVEDG